MSYGPVDWNVTTIRYTSLADVKQRLGLGADATWDAQITEATVAAEVALDAHLGRSFPDVDPDPVITVVPEGVKQVALAAAVGVYQSGSAPFGTTGSDAFALGAVNVPEVIRTEVQRNPLLTGLKVSWGVA